jgi:hypothetical protein
MKYLIIKDGFDRETAILFDEILNHNTIAKNYPIISAGFCSIKNINQITVCWGNSTTLRKNSRGDIDAKIIDKTMYFSG